jgi:RimJ/RimL family protein N-acetyltransferase
LEDAARSLVDPHQFRVDDEERPRSSTEATAMIETGRLRLRLHVADDLAASWAMWSDPLVYRHILPAPSSEQQAWSRILTYAGHWALANFGYWAIEERSTGVFLGEIGFADFKRDITPSIRGVPEMGWVLASAHHGKGYATEGVRAALNWADQHLSADRTVCLINPENAASIHVAQKAGYAQTHLATFNNAPALVFERLRLAS